MSSSLENHFHTEDRSPDYIRSISYADAIKTLREMGEITASIRLGRHMCDLYLHESVWPIRQEYAISLNVNNQLEEAIVTYQKWLNMFKNDAFAWHFYGQLVSKVDTKEFVRAYTEAIRIEPDQSSWYQNLGVGLDELGNVDEAISVWEQGLELDPNDVGIMYNLNLAYDEVGNSSKELELKNRLNEYYRMNPDIEKFD